MIPINYLCDIAEVSRSGYYAWLKAESKRRDREYNDEKDYELINTIYQDHGRTAGWRTIKMNLENEYGVIMNHKRIRRIMKKFKLVCIIRRTNPYKKMMKATKEHRTCPNILDRKFDETTPQRVFLTDITYLHYGNSQKAYLSAIKDVATKEIVAFNVSTSLEMSIVYKTIEKLKYSLDEQIHPEAIIHSDQGVHYTHPEYQKRIKDLGLIQSMSRRGNCWDNAPMESFFGHMKDIVNFKQCKAVDEVKDLINRYMYFYNYERYQWRLKKMTPVEYRNHLIAA